MKQDQRVHFGSYRLIGPRGPLLRRSHMVNLPPKALAVLWQLVQRAGQVVTKEELLAAVWAEAVVGEEVLTSCLRTLRRALADDAKLPRYIATVHRVGYRFIAPLIAPPPVVSGQLSVVSNGAAGRSQLATGNWQPATALVGRETELAQLHHYWEKALNGERQLVFVTGEAGIGKTTLVEAFLTRLAAEHEHELRIGRGRCVEHYGAGEAYLPLFEALSRLCQGAEGSTVLTQLRHFAPNWANQLAGMLPAEEERELVSRQEREVTQERMLRELAEGLEALSRVHPLVLLFEDLHWSDYSTVEALSMLARRHEPARLLMIGTYRPVELILREHPLKAVRQELQSHGQCQTLTLGYLNAAAIETYVDYRFSGRGQKADIAAFLHRRTEGHPLFMVSVADYLEQREIAAAPAMAERERRLAAIEAEVPMGLQQFIEAQVERLRAEEQEVLEAASIAGMEFTVASVAAGLDGIMKAAEEICERLARRGQFIDGQGLAEWVDGTVSGRYRFRHVLYQEVVSARLAPARSVRLHRQMGERLEAGYGKRAREIAAELAVHFEQGRDFYKAVQHLQQAGKNAVQRSAYHEAVQQFTKGLNLLAILPETPERLRDELGLHMDLGGALTVTKGPVAPEVEAVYRRALVLGQRLGEEAQLFGALVGLRSIHCIRAELPAARELADQLVALAQRVSVPALRVVAHYALGETLFHLGEPARALQHLEQALTYYDSRHSQPHTLHVGVFSLGGAAWVQQHLGYAEHARQRVQAALALAQELSHPFNQIYILLLSAYISQSLQDRQLTLERAETAMALCREHGISHWLMYGRMLRGWALAERGQIEQIRQGIQACQKTGAKIGLSHQLAMLADACRRVQQPGEGLKAIADAFTHLRQTGERHQEAELWRLKGELLLSVGERKKGRTKEHSSHSSIPPFPHSSPEACFLKAIAVARQQQAKSFELRAGISLARLWQQHGKGKDAHLLLADIYGWFTEGFDTRDLQDAKALLETLR